MDRGSEQKQTDTPIMPAVDLDEEMRELAALARLEDDWDSFGSKPISHAAIADANDLMTRAAIQYSGIRPYAIAPLSGSGVQLEWRGYNHRLEVEVYGNQRFHYLLIEGQGAHRRSSEKRDASPRDIIDALSFVAAR
jgi:hypothetical protein